MQAMSAFLLQTRHSACGPACDIILGESEAAFRDAHPPMNPNDNAIENKTAI
jgi:hypothetical protein